MANAFSCRRWIEMQTVWREIWKTWIKLWIRGHFVQKRTEFHYILPLKCVLGFFVGERCQAEFNFSGLTTFATESMLFRLQSSRQFASEVYSALTNTSCKYLMAKSEIREIYFTNRPHEWSKFSVFHKLPLSIYFITYSRVGELAPPNFKLISWRNRFTKLSKINCSCTS